MDFFRAAGMFLTIFFLIGCEATPQKGSTEEPALSSPSAAERPAETERFGNVAFSHKAHVGLMPCSECHRGTGGKVAAGKDAGHGLCLDCHNRVAAGPRSCTGCHRQ
ncbi:cytochrome c3 family protein [Desulfuromonas sp. CSMB_57]|jgi:hypothetical protein|uniref:cytochrome c3 family protein n=1 Tax=Desulfuromonas sp. CSMB_57 TaxID=2807629 RepID=UPI001CD40BE1|nr:cytochrome c3 family protein [Desulfuromonas sp. CSMB_57]